MKRSVRIQNAVFSTFLLLYMAGTPASAAAESWHSLSSEQQKALAPLAQQWDTLPEKQQDRLLKTAKRYPHLTPEQQQRFHNRLTVWSKLTPEQREAAREKYSAFKKVPADKREQVKQMVQQEQEKKPGNLPAGFLIPIRIRNDHFVGFVFSSGRFA